MGDIRVTAEPGIHIDRSLLRTGLGAIHAWHPPQLSNMEGPMVDANLLTGATKRVVVARDNDTLVVIGAVFNESSLRQLEQEARAAGLQDIQTANQYAARDFRAAVSARAATAADATPPAAATATATATAAGGQVTRKSNEDGNG